MDDTGKEVIKSLIPFFNMFLMILILFTFIFMQQAPYQQNIFEITINNNNLRNYYEEKYHNLLTTKKTSGYHSSNTDTIFNKIDKSDKYILYIEENEVYDKNNLVKESSSWNKNDKYRYIEVDDSIIKLKIETKNGIIYDGDYKKDITEFIKDNGRYYFHIYVKSKRKLFSYVETNISFNILVGDTNE